MGGHPGTLALEHRSRTGPALVRGPAKKHALEGWAWEGRLVAVPEPHACLSVCMCVFGNMSQSAKMQIKTSLTACFPLLQTAPTKLIWSLQSVVWDKVSSGVCFLSPKDWIGPNCSRDCPQPPVALPRPPAFSGQLMGWPGLPRGMPTLEGKAPPCRAASRHFPNSSSVVLSGRQKGSGPHGGFCFLKPSLYSFCLYLPPARRWFHHCRPSTEGVLACGVEWKVLKLPTWPHCLESQVQKVLFQPNRPPLSHEFWQDKPWKWNVFLKTSENTLG